MARYLDDFGHVFGSAYNSLIDEGKHRISIFEHIPRNLHSAILARTHNGDLAGYIQQALDRAKSESGGVIVFPPGRYPHSTLSSVGSEMISLVGAGRWYGGTMFDYIGGGEISAIRMTNCSNWRYNGIFFRSPTRCGAFIESKVDDAQPMPTGAPGAHRFEDLVFYGYTGLADWGVVMYCATGSDHNNSENVFVRCLAEKIVYAPFAFRHAQSKNNLLIQCGWGEVEHGIYCEKGAFRCYSAHGGYATLADVYLGAPNDVIIIDGCNFEGSRRTLYTGGTSSGCPVVITNNRIAPTTNLAPDRFTIQHGFHSGPLIIRGNTFGEIGSPTPVVYVNGSQNGHALQGELSFNLFVGTDAETIEPLTSAYSQKLKREGNTYMQTNGDPRVRASEQPGTVGQSGTVVFNEATQIVVVNLPQPEPDANYRIVMTASDYTGTPRAGSAVVEYARHGGSTVDFTVLLQEAPGNVGSGASRTFAWQLVR